MKPRSAELRLQELDFEKRRLKMPKTVWKFMLKPDMLNMVQVPAGAEPLTAQMQGDNLVMWALVDPEMPKVNRKFLVIGAGFDINYAIVKYIGTFQLYGGSFVQHVFEVK